MSGTIKGWEDWEHLDIISDPLAWQAKIDAASPAPINTHGAARFWKTIQARGLPVVFRNGSPDISEIVFNLGEGVGLQLKIEQEGAIRIEYRFVALKDYHNWGWQGAELRKCVWGAWHPIAEMCDEPAVAQRGGGGWYCEKHCQEYDRRAAEGTLYQNSQEKGIPHER